MRRMLKKDIVEERKKIKGFNEYILKKYKEKGIRAVRYSEGIDELDILLGIKKSSKFDDEDKKYLTEEQIKELVRLERLD